MRETAAGKLICGALPAVVGWQPGGMAGPQAAAESRAEGLRWGRHSQSCVRLNDFPYLCVLTRKFKLIGTFHSPICFPLTMGWGPEDWQVEGMSIAHQLVLAG